ncbi:MAG: hypothetical protein DMG36_16750 [Acidobacteria bacterium]|nr:MAG: hypothetical protein DMG36_16750 [Acidobacteriota bacterium]
MAHHDFRFAAGFRHTRTIGEVFGIIQKNVMSKSIVSTALSNVQLEPGSIPREWLLSGNPETRSKLLVRSHDWISDVVVWECGAVSYRWHYDQDEAYLVLSGEGFMTDDKGVERRFGPGDVAYFPAGTDTTWRHPDHFRKIAFLKESFSRPVGFGLKAWNKLLRMVGLKGGSLAFLLAMAVMTTRNPR